MTSVSGQNLPGGGNEQLGLLFTQIGEAQTLDSNGDELGAYRHYLSSVSLAMQVLSTDIQANQGQGTLAEQKVKQLFKMARHCLERGEDIFNTARKEQRPLALFRLATPSPVASPTLSTPPTAVLSQSASPALSTTTRTVPAGHESSWGDGRSISRGRSATMTEGTHRASLTPHSSPHTRRTTLSHRGTQPSLSSSGGTAPTGVGGQSKAANWMAGKRAKLSGLPGLLGRKDGGVDAVDGPSSSGAGGAYRSGGSGPTTGQGGAAGNTGGGGGNQTVAGGQTHTIRAMSSYREEAELRNRHVMEQYQSLLRKHKSSPTTPVSNEARLSMLRRLEENLSVARIREQNIARRLKEKAKRDKEAEAKAKQAVTYSSLSVDELCDHVTSFEHGKSQISSLKAHLNASDSDPSAVYSAISEILSIVDHPLSRLLGECQYTIVMTLQPIVSAVEKAGGLPRVNITLDQDLINRGSCPRHTPAYNKEGKDTAAAVNGEDDILTLLDDGDDDDDVLGAIGKRPPHSKYPPNAPEPPKSNIPPGQAVCVSDAFDEKLSRLKRELTQSVTSGEDNGMAGSEGRGGEDSEVYEDMDAEHTRIYQNTSGPESEARIHLQTGESELDSTKESELDSRVYQNTNELKPDSRVYQNVDGSEYNSRIYQNTSATSEESRTYQNVGASLDDSDLTNAPMFDSELNTAAHDNDSSHRAGSKPCAESNLYTELPEPNFSLKSNDSYGTLAESTGRGHYDVPRPHPRTRSNVPRSHSQGEGDNSEPRPQDEAAQSVIDHDNFSLRSNDSYGTLAEATDGGHYDVPRPHPRKRSNVPRPHSRGQGDNSEPHPRPLDEAAQSIIDQDRNVYEDVENISKLLRGNDLSNKAEEAHLYEALEGLLEKGEELENKGGANDVSQVYEEVDGGMMSHPLPAPRKPQEVEMQKLVVFHNLPPLVATMQCGDDVTLGKLSDTANSVITEVNNMVQKSFKTLQQCFSSCYPILSSEDNQEVCHTVLEASFFPAIISLLTTVNRCKNYKDEVTIANNMALHVNATPKDLAVRDKYWLIEQTYAPYGEAIDEVRQVSNFPYPSSKLECVVRMSKRVVKCIEEYFKQYHPDKNIDLVGVDDMLPIFSYVILRSGMPELVSECSIMEQFIQEGYIMGEEGFCLTSFLTALRYLINMSALKS